MQIDHKCNKTGECYPNRIYSKEHRPQFKRMKLSHSALFRKTQHRCPRITFLLLSRKSISALTLFPKILVSRPETGRCFFFSLFSIVFLLFLKYFYCMCKYEYFIKPLQNFKTGPIKPLLKYVLKHSIYLAF